MLVERVWFAGSIIAYVTAAMTMKGVAAFNTFGYYSRQGANSSARHEHCISFRSSPGGMRLHAWFPNEGMEMARGSFSWWLFGAAGSGGVARSAIPKLFDEYRELQRLKGVGPTLGGEQLIQLAPLTGYPEPLRLKDVEMVVNNPLSVERMVVKFPIEGNFLSAKGYLTRDSFELANAKANPLPVRAVFESFGKPKVVEPETAQRLLNEYKQDPMMIQTNLLKKSLTVYASAVTLLFLLGLADVAAACDAYRGWFPDWPGGQDFPWRLLTEDGNPFTIGDYFLWDIPPGRIIPPQQ